MDDKHLPVTVCLGVDEFFSSMTKSQKLKHFKEDQNQHKYLMELSDIYHVSISKKPLALTSDRCCMFINKVPSYEQTCVINSMVSIINDSNINVIVCGVKYIYFRDDLLNALKLCYCIKKSAYITGKLLGYPIENILSFIKYNHPCEINKIDEYEQLLKSLDYLTPESFGDKITLYKAVKINLTPIAIKDTVLRYKINLLI